MSALLFIIFVLVSCVGIFCFLIEAFEIGFIFLLLAFILAAVTVTYSFYFS